MRAVDDPMPVWLEILRLLAQYGPLPESDVTKMLRHRGLVTNDYREMEEQGFIRLAFIGDEYVLTTDVLGRLLLEE